MTTAGRTPVADAVSGTAWLRAMLDTRAALSRAQARTGAVPAWAAEVITEAALGLAERLDLSGPAASADPVTSLLAALSDEVARDHPAAAGYVRLGSTRDITDTGTMLVAARASRVIRADLTTVAVTLGELVSRHRAGTGHASDVVWRTVADWRRLVLDAHRRLGWLLFRGLPVSLGNAGALDERLLAIFAEETGLARPAPSRHLPGAGLAATLAFVSGALGTIATDVMLLTGTAPGAAPRPSGHVTGPATRVRGAASRVSAIAATLNGRASTVAWEPLRDCLLLTGAASRATAGLIGEPQVPAGLELTASGPAWPVPRPGANRVSRRRIGSPTTVPFAGDAAPVLDAAADLASHRGHPAGAPAGRRAG